MIRDLLILLSKYPPEENNRKALSELIERVQDWSKLIALINSHGIIALAAANLEAARLEKLVPEQVMSALGNGLLQSVVRNAWLAGKWKEVNKILSDAGIRHIVLKGMALEHTVYESKGLRQMNDNDILIRREECLKAWKLLQKEGFTPEIVKSKLHYKILLDSGKHLPSLYKDGYSVEIHHRLSDDISFEGPGSIDPFASAVEITIAGEKALTLSKDLQLKYLISHFEKHKEEGACQLRLYADILLLDKNSKIVFPDQFIENPKQEMKKEYRKAAWKKTVLEVPAKYRFRFVLGDVFPSPAWMRNRYKCSTAKALLYYPARIGKVGWLMGGKQHTA
jgi:hypothetical protein